MQPALSPMRLKYLAMRPNGNFKPQTLEWRQRNDPDGTVIRYWAPEPLPFSVFQELLTAMAQGLSNPEIGFELLVAHSESGLLTIRGRLASS